MPKMKPESNTEVARVDRVVNREPAVKAADGEIVHQQFDVYGLALDVYIDVDGELLFHVGQLNDLLEYAPKALQTMVGRNWADEFEDGKHVRALSGERLRRLVDSESTSQSPKGVDSESTPFKQAKSVMFVTEAGLDRVFIKTEKPIGRIVRGFYADHIAPRLRRGLGIPATATAEQAALTEDPRMVRERRLGKVADAALQRAETERRDMEMRWAEKVAGVLAGVGVKPDLLAGWLAGQFQDQTGRETMHLLPSLDLTRAFVYAEDMAEIVARETGIFARLCALLPDAWNHG